MTDVLIFGDTERSPELRHEVPVSIGDPLIYAEAGGVRHAIVSSLELARVQGLDGLDVHVFEEFGYEELIARGAMKQRLWPALAVNVAQALGIADATVPMGFPLACADELREAGVALRVDQRHFDDRRRVKNAAELEGMRRASRAVEAGLEHAKGLLRSADRSDGVLTLDGQPLTCERIKADLERIFAEHGAAADSFTVSHGAQTAVGHDPGCGPIASDDVVLLDLYPRDRETGCFTDFTRTLAVGRAPEELVRLHALAKEALDLALGMIRPGVEGKEIHRAVSELFHEHGEKTQLHKEQGEVLQDGFPHATGHGVGLEVHEQPGVGRTGEAFVVGDVLAIEPGLYRSGRFGVRLEDLVLVEEDGYELLTRAGYELEP